MTLALAAGCWKNIPPTLSGGINLCPGQSDVLLEDATKIAASYGLERVDGAALDDLRPYFFKYREQDVAALLNFSRPERLNYQLYSYPFAGEERYKAFEKDFRLALSEATTCDPSPAQ